MGNIILALILKFSKGISMKRSTYILLFFCPIFFACGEAEEVINVQETPQQMTNSSIFPKGYGAHTSFPHRAQQERTASINHNQQILIIDSGLNMPMGRLITPYDWKVRYDIASNLHTAAYDRYIIDIQGPDGSVIRGMGSATYLHSGGTNFDSLVEKMAMAGVQGIEGLTYGEFSINQRALARPKYQQAIQKAKSQGYQLEPVYLSFQGTISGRRMAGRLEVDHSIFVDGGQHIGGAVNVVLLMSSPENIESLIRMSDAISDQFQANLEYDRARSQLIDRVTARRYGEHKQRMAQNQARFNAHQQMMKGRYEAAYSQNEQWLQNFRNQNSSGDNAYSGHDKFIDSINETTSFNDPSTGFRTSQDGQYDRWATDGQGNYIGSDDPSFDPNAIEGNWREAQPLN